MPHQGAVWRDVAEALTRSGASSKTGNYLGVHRTERARFLERAHHAAVRLPSAANGVLVQTAGGRATVEVFPTARSLRLHQDDLVADLFETHEAAVRGGQGFPPGSSPRLGGAELPRPEDVLRQLAAAPLRPIHGGRSGARSDAPGGGETLFRSSNQGPSDAELRGLFGVHLMMASPAWAGLVLCTDTCGSLVHLQAVQV